MRIYTFSNTFNFQKII